MAEDQKTWGERLKEELKNVDLSKAGNYEPRRALEPGWVDKDKYELTEEEKRVYILACQYDRALADLVASLKGNGILATDDPRAIRLALLDKKGDWLWESLKLMIFERLSLWYKHNTAVISGWKVVYEDCSSDQKQSGTKTAFTGPMPKWTM